jgi:hypothetical protein
MLKINWALIKMIETQLAQIATAIPVSNEGKISRQPKNSLEKLMWWPRGMVSPLVIHKTLTIKQEKQKGNTRTDLHHLQKHKRTTKTC